jgi:hypothetical protein
MSSRLTRALGGLANDQQIIVFTCNVWFAAELLARANVKELKRYDIRSEGGDPACSR